MEHLRRVRDGGLPMHSGGQADMPAPHVRQHAHVIRARHRRDLAAFAKPARNADIGLHDIQGALLDQLAERPSPGQALGACNADGQRAFDRQVPAHIVGGQWLFVPKQIVVRDLVPHVNGRAHVIAAVGIHGKQHPIPNGLPDRGGVFDIVSRAKSDLHFYRGKPQIDVFLRLIHEHLRHIRAVLAK